ncbi:MAG TPA: DNA primase [Candidatus Saccharimonadia bacterium]|nr:DNA primase [Candidatus Saccharimonadia bacterium]
MSDQIQEIKSAVDIVELIGERVQLTHNGKNFRGLCPFHSEKTPSFFVTPELQRYKCFGCGRSGDVYTFLEEYETLTFAEALQQLADRAGIRLEKQVFSQEDQHRKRLYEVLDLAREYYHYILTEHRLGIAAREYLQKRGLHAETIKTFGIGYALNSWDALQNFLVKKKKYSWTELRDVGLVIERTGHNAQGYDRFRHRIMFPLTDGQGRTVGFSGRIMDGDAKEAKYINSSETALYHKSELLFGYSVLKNFIRKEEEVIIVEGEFDVLSSYQAEVKNVVAIKGSALSEAQVKLLARSVKKIILSLDADSAGVEATKRAIITAREYDVSLRVLPLIGGKDPDEIAKEFPKNWREMTKNTVSVYQFLIDAAFRDRDIKSGEGLREITKEVVPVLASINNAVEQAHYITETAKRLGVNEDALETELRRFSARQTLPPSPMKVVPALTKPKKLSKLEGLERYALTLLLHMEPEQVARRVDGLKSMSLTTPMLQKLLELFITFLEKHQYDAATFARSVPAEFQETLSELYLEPLDDKLDLEKEWLSTLDKFNREKLGTNMRAVTDEIAKLEQKAERSEAEEAALEQMQKDFVKLSASAYQGSSLDTK